MIRVVDWLELVRVSVLHPRDGARRILAMQIRPLHLWELLFLTAVLSALVVMAGFIFDPESPISINDTRMPEPMAFVVVQFLASVLTAGAIHFIGRSFGGIGTWAGALALVVWMQFLLFLLQLVQLVLFLLVPVLADLMGFASILLTLWLLVHFVAELHGFRRIGFVVLGVFLSFLAIGMLVAMALYPLGISIQGGA